MANLLVSLRLRATDGISSVARRVRSEIEKIGEAAKSAKMVSEDAADLAAARSQVSGFASSARSAIAELVSSADTFEDKMAILSAESGRLSGEQLSRMTTAIYDVAKATRFTSEVVQDGMLTMVGAGFDAEGSISALAPAARLASITGSDLTSTALLTSRAIRAFGLQAEDATRVTDVLRAGVGEAGVSLSQMGELLAKLGPRAKGVGDDIESTAAVIAGFGQAGITGAAGAQALEEVFKRLGKGELRTPLAAMGINPKEITGVIDLLEKLAKDTEKYSAAQRERGFAGLFGEAGSAVARLTEGIREGTVDLVQLRQQMAGSSGTVTALTDIMKNGAGSAHRLSETWKELKNTLGASLSPGSERFKNAIADLLEGVISFAKENPAIVKALGYTASAVAAVATLISGALSAALAIVGTKAALTFVGGFSGIAKLLAGPVVLAVKGLLLPLNLLAAGLAKTMVAAVPLAAPFVALGAAIASVTLAVDQLVKHWDELDFLEGIKGIADSIGDSGVLSTLGELFDPRTLLRDVGIMGPENRIAPGVAAPGGGAESKVSGAIAIKVDSEGHPRVDRMESKGVELDVSTGYTLAGAMGGF